jgi:hypothetical protein
MSIITYSPYRIPFKDKTCILDFMLDLKNTEEVCTAKYESKVCKNKSLYKFVFNCNPSSSMNCVLSNSSLCEIHTFKFQYENSVIVKISDLMSDEFRSYMESLLVIEG